MYPFFRRPVRGDGTAHPGTALCSSRVPAASKVYSEIRRETGASSATVSRVNRMLNYGTGSVAESVRYDLARLPEADHSEEA